MFHSEKGAKIAETPEEAIEGAKVIISILFDYPALVETILAKPRLLANKTLIQVLFYLPFFFLMR